MFSKPTSAPKTRDALTSPHPATRNAIVPTGRTPTSTDMEKFFEKNRSVLSMAEVEIASLDDKSVDSTIYKLEESSEVVLDFLGILSEVHPAIQVVVDAFRLIVKTDKTRRENNQKVKAVKIQMHQMMCTLYQLRRFEGPDYVGPDGKKPGDSLQSLMQQIAQDIKECHLMCDKYLKKNIVAKVLKSSVYEGRLADYAAKFMEYRVRLNTSLSADTASGVRETNARLDIQSSDLQFIKEKCQLFEELFRKLNTKHESDALEFIQHSGGSEAVIERTDLIQVLVQKVGETMGNLAGSYSANDSDIDSVKLNLRKEWEESLDVALRRNLILFDRKLGIREESIKEIVEKHGKYILSSGTHDEIQDMHLRNLWKELGSKRNVNSRKFVLTMRDYFTDTFTTNLRSAGGTSTIQRPGSSTANHLPEASGELWALEYLSVHSVQAISEAIDDDGSDTISIREVNTFVNERPKSWSLLCWVAFWAKGWEISLVDYKNEINLILQEITRLLPKVLEENKGYVGVYFRHRGIAGVQLVLQSTKAAKVHGEVHRRLTSATEAYVSEEKEKLRKKLEKIEYDMDNAATVGFVTGPARIERYLFPLLYLTLKQHLKAFHYACRHPVSSEDFLRMATALDSIFDVVDQRIETLGANYKQIRANINTCLENFALGIFWGIATSGYTYDSEDSLNKSWQHALETKNTPDDNMVAKDPGHAITSGTVQSPDLSLVNSFYESNHSMISTAVAGITSHDDKSINNALFGFGDSFRVVMEGLESLSHIHPFIGVAVVAFKLVVTLNMARRENKRKVVAVNIRMQQMMCTLFQLRRIKDPDEVGPGGTTLKDRMQPLMMQVAQDIKECGSACDVYLKKSFIARVLKSEIYADCLANYAVKFMGNRDALKKALNAHIALGVGASNEELNTQSSQLQSIKVLFNCLDTPREREVVEFIDKNGGARAVIERNDLVQGLIKKSGETMSNLADKSLTSKHDIDLVKEMLKRELEENVDEVLKRNFTLFDRKLEIQNRNIRDALEKRGKHSNVSAGTDDEILDSDLRDLWKHMGWRRGVKARHFVMNLRDYFTDKLTMGGGFQSRIGASMSTELSPATQAVPSVPALGYNQWTLRHLSVPNIPSILEAIDEDGGRFIHAKQVVTFATERPSGWSLLHWVAFWAKGWEMNVAGYKTKIALILQEMGRLYPMVLKENWKHVDVYLQCSGIARVHLIFRSTKADKEHGHMSFELDTLAEAYARAEEERLQHNLSIFGYDIDSSDIVEHIIRYGRIEHYLFPLLYLTLKRHLEVFHYARRHFIASTEFYHMAATLRSIFDVVKQRIETLKATYNQNHADLNAYFGKFSFGMFHDLAMDRSSYDPHESLLVSWNDHSRHENESDKSGKLEDLQIPQPIYSDPNSEDTYYGIWQGWPPHSFGADPCTGTLNGFWTGQFRARQGKGVIRPHRIGLVQLKIVVDPDDHRLLEGFAVTYSGQLEVYGKRRWSTGVDSEIEEFDMVLSFDDGESVRLVGRMVKENEELVGEWATFSSRWSAREAYDAHPFSIDRPTEGQKKDEAPSQMTNHDVGQAEDGKEIEASTKQSAAETEGTEGVADEGVPSTAGADILVEAEGEKKPVSGTFAFGRTPAEIHKFKHILDNDEGKAKARWNFLREAVLHLIRLKLWSRNYFKAWLVDRRAFLDCYRREWFRSHRFVIQNPLTEEERETWWTMRNRLPPAMISLCVESLLWSLNRLPYHSSVECGHCHLRPFEPRFICLKCIDPKLSNSFDLCCQCVGKSVKRDEFIHTTDHTLIKSRQYVPGYLFPWLIKEARSMTTRLQRTLAELSKEGHIGRSGLLCGCCRKPLNIPFWACITCAPETYVCNDCEEKALPVLGEGPGSPVHHPEHHLLRLHNLGPDCFDTEGLDPIVARVDDLEGAVERRIETLESCINARMAGLESRINSLEVKTEALLTSMGTLVREIRAAAPYSRLPE